MSRKSKGSSRGLALTAGKLQMEGESSQMSSRQEDLSLIRELQMQIEALQGEKQHQDALLAGMQVQRGAGWHWN